MTLLISDPKSKVTYRQLGFLGKGGFARCYEFENTTTGETFAGKVVPKKLMKPKYEELRVQEIEIHSSLNHKFIVPLLANFEDESNIYIILELCRKRSLMEMLKVRKTLTVPEVRYFMRQIVLACKYMHDNKVIHRDLKPQNLLINDDMEIKVGDFGLATRISHEGEKETLSCGTPNYSAPEMLAKSGYSFEVDIWSLGCIMYTLLVGSPPFDSDSLPDTRRKIRRCDYRIPFSLEQSARLLIQKLLDLDPKLRPTADVILVDDFFTSGCLPSCLPSSCLTTQPKFSHNALLGVPMIENQHSSTLFDSAFVDTSNTTSEEVMQTGIKTEISVKIVDPTMPKDFYLKDLLRMVNSVVQCRPDVIYTGHPEDAQDPSALPLVWISKWVDYSEKFGVAYQLCDDSLGVLFNDATSLVRLQDGSHLQYIEHSKEEKYLDLENYPKEMQNKVNLLNHFDRYMTENLLKEGEGGKIDPVPYLRAWFRTDSAGVFHLTNGTLQAKLYQYRTTIILCPLKGAIFLIDEHQNKTVYTMQLIEKFGCSPSLASHLKLVKNMVEKLYNDFLSKDDGIEHDAAVIGSKRKIPQSPKSERKTVEIKIDEESESKGSKREIPQSPKSERKTVEIKIDKEVSESKGSKRKIPQSPKSEKKTVEIKIDKEESESKRSKREIPQSPKSERKTVEIKIDKDFKDDAPKHRYPKRSMQRKSYKEDDISSKAFNGHRKKNHHVQSNQRYSSQHCSFSSDRPHNLEDRLSHSDKRPHQCTHCPKAFTVKSSLNRHFLLHAKEKRYFCNKCRSTFSRLCQLRTHEKLHERGSIFKCLYCRRSFSQAGNLKKHERVHVKKRPFTCPHCDYQSSKAAVLGYHIVSKHKTNFRHMCS